MPEPKLYIVGRQAEVELFDRLVVGQTSYWLLNIYGPGGIGKTVVCQKLEAHARQQGLPFATIQGDSPDLTPDRLLYYIQEGLTQGPGGEKLADAFGDFGHRYEDYLIVQDILQRGGGLPTMFDVVGNVKDPAGLTKTLAELGKTVSEEVRRTVHNRFALERYLRGVDRALTTSLVEGIGAAMERARQPIIILVDTYEEMEGLDDWVCRTLVRELPDGVKVVIFGRNRLHRINFDWDEYGEAVTAMELPELSEADAKAYLVHHGLRDTATLDEIYQFIGGYPLLLVLVVHLARESGGWEAIGALERSADRDFVATQLLNRILREERVHEVRDFLERGCVARWFDPEVVSVIMEVNITQGRAIYDKLLPHSFVERHPYGLKLHDKIRELLLERLKFTNMAEYMRLTDRLMAYYAQRAGIVHPWAAEGVNAQVTILLENDIDEFTSDKQETFVSTLSRIVSTSPDQIRILQVVPGSVLVTLEMPEEAAQRLISMYLARDSVLQTLGILKVELQRVIASPDIFRQGDGPGIHQPAERLPDERPKTESPTDAKYTIHIEHVEGIVIGDQTEVRQSFDQASPEDPDKASANNEQPLTA